MDQDHVCQLDHCAYNSLSLPEEETKCWEEEQDIHLDRHRQTVIEGQEIKKKGLLRTSLIVVLFGSG